MIKFNNLSFRYKKRPVFEEVSFELKSGIHGLLGENGVGKTTLLHLITGLHFPNEGSCKVFDYESAYRNPKMLNKIFFLPEEFQTASLSVKDYIKYNAVFYDTFSQAQCDKYLIEFQVDKERKISELSLGQKKKALIAYALSLNTPITLLDEPTNGLDIPSKAQFRKMVASAFDDEKCIIISTHQVRDLDNLIDPIIILDRNQVLLNNSVEEITSKLLFSCTSKKPEETLYCEQTIQGYCSVQINKYGEENTLNMEALFNAVVNNKAKIKELFNQNLL